MKTSLTIADLNATLTSLGLSFRNFPYATIKQASVKTLRPLANAGLLTIVKMPPSGYSGKRELRVFLTEISARAMYGENSNQFRVISWWPTIEGHKIVAQAKARRTADPLAAFFQQDGEGQV